MQSLYWQKNRVNLRKMGKTKKDKNLLLKIEDILISWIIVKRHQIFLYLIVFILLIISSSIPYVNLVFSRTLIIFLLFFLGLIIFNVSKRNLIFIAIVFFILALPFVLTREYESAEALGNLIYGVLLVGVIKAALDINAE